MNWEAITGTIAGYLWALPLIIVALTSGLIYSIRLRFPQVRRIKDKFKLMRTELLRSRNRLLDALKTANEYIDLVV